MKKTHTMKTLVSVGLILSSALFVNACSDEKQKSPPQKPSKNEITKPVVYQVFTRLFGNTHTVNTPWGTIEQNGVGKFADFNDAALDGIKELGTTHIWYTGVLHHALVGDYTDYGIEQDDPDVVKGRAGSPYAIKDYYDVNPDLAINVANRLDEFSELIKRTHDHDMKVIIDIVPNHVARKYHSTAKPKGVKDFGEQDDTTVEYDKNNNFYYVPGKSFQVPTSDEKQVLGGESHPLADGFFNETPAKWTGNGARSAHPDINDWYETVKVNYGVKPDGSYDFPTLPKELENQDYRAHYAFWQNKTLPNSWYKFRDIALYWLDKGVDGFRYDMAEMVPVEFWSFLNSSIKMQKPDAFLLAEVYDPKKYRAYINQGKMDYLYDKVGFYDTLKAIMQDKQAANTIFDVQNRVADIEQHMLHFLENHDEQRIASPAFAGKAAWGKPAMVVSNLISRSPSLIYFAQELGEKGAENAGFGSPTRTSIFDYIGVPAHQAWMNNGKFDGAGLTPEQVALRQYYASVMALNNLPAVVGGDMQPLKITGNDAVVGFTRTLGQQTLLIVSNLSEKPHTVTVSLTKDQATNINQPLHDLLEQHDEINISKNQQNTTFTLALNALGSAVLTNKATND